MTKLQAAAPAEPSSKVAAQAIMAAEAICLAAEAI